jgi:hypothetical protein
MEQLKRYNLQWDSDHPERPPKINKADDGFWMVAERVIRNESEFRRQLECMTNTHKLEIVQIKDENNDRIAQLTADHERMMNKVTEELKHEH